MTFGHDVTNTNIFFKDVKYFFIYRLAFPRKQFKLANCVTKSSSVLGFFIAIANANKSIIVL